MNTNLYNFYSNSYYPLSYRINLSLKPWRAQCEHEHGGTWVSDVRVVDGWNHGTVDHFREVKQPLGSSLSHNHAWPRDIWPSLQLVSRLGTDKVTFSTAGKLVSIIFAKSPCAHKHIRMGWIWWHALLTWREQWTNGKSWGLLELVFHFVCIGLIQALVALWCPGTQNNWAPHVGGRWLSLKKQKFPSHISPCVCEISPFLGTFFLVLPFWLFHMHKLAE